jgi:hypothetical protein
MNRIGEMFPSEEVGDAAIGRIVEQNCTQKRLLSFHIGQWPVDRLRLEQWRQLRIHRNALAAIRGCGV